MHADVADDDDHVRQLGQTGEGVEPDGVGGAYAYGPRRRAFVRALEWTAGNAPRAAALLEQAAPFLESDLSRANARRLEAALRSSSVPGDSAAVLLQAARDLERLDLRLARDTYAEALQAALLSAQLTRGTTPAEVARWALAAPPDPADQPTVADLIVEGLATRVLHGYRAAVPALRRGVAAMSADDIESSTIVRWAVLGNDAAADLWDADGSVTLLSRLERSERERGALDPLCMTLDGLAHCHLRAGRFDAAEQCHSEAHSIAVALGGSPMIWRLFRVELTAWQGDDDLTRSLAEKLGGRLADASGGGALANLASISLIILEVGRGNYAAALPHARRLFDDDPPPFGNQVLPELVEVAVRSGHSDLAAEAEARLAERAQASGTPWALGLAARSAALLADDAEAEPLYRAAIEQLGRTPVRTDLARAHLLYGEWLRREARRVDARTELRQAHEMFAAMGAGAFADAPGSSWRPPASTLGDGSCRRPTTSPPRSVRSRDSSRPAQRTTRWRRTSSSAPGRSSTT